MKLKKPTTVKNPTVKAAPGGAPAEGGAPAGGAKFNDRLRLDRPDPNKSTVGRKATAWALGAGVVALVVAGVLVYTMWKHWEFLMPA